MLKNRTRFITLVIFFVGAIFLSVQKWYGDYKSRQKVQSTVITVAKKLSREEYDKIKEEFLAIVNNQSPKVALAELRERIKTDNALLRSCHALIHEIGHEAYVKYGHFAEAMRYQDEICNSGYLHGIIESHFSKSQDVFVAMKEVCNGYRLGSFLSWECYHGTGHGLMYYTSNDLPRSLEMCDSYDNSFASSNCANGVFMENFNTDQKLHPSKFLKADDLFYPCQEQAERHKRDCYLYAPTYYLSLKKNDYVGALGWCEGAELMCRSTCAGGVGSQAIKENINNPKFVEKICMSNKSAQVNPCIGGMIGLYINHYGSLESARKLCDQLEVSNRQTCSSSIKSSSGLF